jgi:hypothetical protein
MSPTDNNDLAEYIPKYFAEFQAEVLKQIGRLFTVAEGNARDVNTLVERVGKQNGRVDKLEGEVTKINLRNATRETTCPMMESVELHLAGLRAEVQAASLARTADVAEAKGAKIATEDARIALERMLSRAWPVLKWVIVLLLGLALGAHKTDLLKLMTGTGG